MGGFWLHGEGNLRAARGRQAILLLVVLVHLLILLALVTARNMASSLTFRRGATLSVLLEPQRPPLPTRPATKTRRTGGSPVPASTRETMDAALPAIASPVQIEVHPLAGLSVTGSAPSTGQGLGIGPGGAGEGRGSGSGDASGKSDQPGIGAGMNTGPAWVHQITNDELLPMLGDKLKRRGLSVSLLLSCEILLTRHVRNCQVLNETPADSGVGPVIDRASRYFRVEPARRNGVATDGERVTILWNVHVLPGHHLDLDVPPSVQ